MDIAGHQGWWVDVGKGVIGIGLVVISQVNIMMIGCFRYDDEEDYYVSLGNKGYLR